MLFNLAGNAVKFTASGRIDIALNLPLRSADTAHVEFCVTDTGIGISEDVPASLFQSFFQGDSSYRRSFAGTGLELAISKQIVELMGGEIGVKSRPGHGANFWFRVPFEIPAQAAPEAEELPLVRSGSEVRILLAEDNPVNQIVARRILERLGYQVDVVGDGELAVRAARTGRYDAILVDCQMPRMDGLEAAAIIRAEPGLEGIPIIALTANNLPDDREICMAAGMNDYVAKPISLRTLGECLRRWTGRIVNAPAS